MLGPLYEQSYANYVGRLDPGCEDGQNLVELSILAGPEDLAELSTPWEAMSGEESGAWLSYMPCDTGIDEARYILGSTGRWFVSVVEFDDELYEADVRPDARQRDQSDAGLHGERPDQRCAGGPRRLRGLGDHRPGREVDSGHAIFAGLRGR